MLVLRFPRVLAVAITLILVILIFSLMGLLVTAVVEKVVDTVDLDDYKHGIEAMMLDGYDRLVKVREYFEPREEVVVEEGEGAGENGVVRSNLVEEETKPLVPYFDANGVLIFPDANTSRVTLEPAGGEDLLLVATPQTAPEPSDPNVGLAESDPNTPNELPRTGADLIKSLIVHYETLIMPVGLNAGKATWNIVSSIIFVSIFVSIFVIFLLSGRNPRTVRNSIYTDIEQKIRRYIITKVAISSVTGLLVWFSLERLGLELASVFGIMAFLLNFIPSVGSIISTVLPVPIAVVQFQSGEGWLWLVMVILVPGSIQFVIGSLIDPKLMGEGLNLHPVTILLALSFWGLLWGIVGAFLAAPITAAIRIVLMQFDTLKPVGMLLAGEFASQADYSPPAPEKDRTESNPEE
ncbi:MAG: AI-2E family transporter [Planctomycetes bacterium]|nr:AI-2E family transporter [Planctomycetota bacterium]